MKTSDPAEFKVKLEEILSAISEVHQIQDTVKYLAASSKLDFALAQLVTSNQETLLQALEAFVKHSSAGGSIERAMRETFSSCDCGCYRVCCSMCGDDKGHSVSLESLGINYQYIPTGMGFQIENDIWSAIYTRLGKELRITMNGLQRRTVLEQDPQTLEEFIRVVMPYINSMMKDHLTITTPNNSNLDRLLSTAPIPDPSAAIRLTGRRIRHAVQNPSAYSGLQDRENFILREVDMMSRIADKLDEGKTQ